MTRISRISHVHYLALAITMPLYCLMACDVASAVQPGGTKMPRSEPDTHIVRSHSLRSIMQRLETLVQDRIQSDLTIDKERMRQAQEIANAAGELAATASSISAAATYAGLDDDARRRFDNYAEELHREAEELQRLAVDKQLAQSAAQYERMSHACAGCHSVFRAR